MEITIMLRDKTQIKTKIYIKLRLVNCGIFGKEKKRKDKKTKKKNCGGHVHCSTREHYDGETSGNLFFSLVTSGFAVRSFSSPTLRM